MSYTPLPCYSVTAACRKKARKVIRADFTDEQINVIQNQIYSLINGKFHKHTDPFTTNDPDYPGIALIESDLVAAELIKYYGDDMSYPIAQSMQSLATLRLSEMMEDTSEEIGDISDEVEKTEFKSWNKNTDTEIPRGGLTVS